MSEAYESLRDLAQLVEVESHSLDLDSTIIEGRDWITPGTVYVNLVYEPNSNDRLELNDSYPISVYFSVEDGPVTVKRVIADTSSFYE